MRLCLCVLWLYVWLRVSPCVLLLADDGTGVVGVRLPLRLWNTVAIWDQVRSLNCYTAVLLQTNPFFHVQERQGHAVSVCTETTTETSMVGYDIIIQMVNL